MNQVKKIWIFLLCTVWMSTQIQPVLATSDPFPTVSAPYAFVQNQETGRILYQKNAQTPVPMASTTKIMTAILVSENCSLSEIVTVSAQAAETTGSTMHLAKGEQITVRALLYGLLLVSGNDAAVALAEHISGSVEDFCVLMNAKSAALELTNTHFTSPHGLDHPDHYTTAADLGKMAQLFSKDPLLSDICNTKLITIEGHTMTNTNPLLGVSPYVYGIKTGYTGNAGYCLVLRAEHQGASYIIVLLGCPTSKDRRRDAFNATNYVVEQYRLYDLYPKGYVVGSLDIGAGKMVKTDAVLPNKIQCVLQAEERNQVKSIFTPIQGPVQAPLRHDQTIGIFRLYVGSECIYEGDVNPFMNVDRRSFLDAILEVLTAWVYLF
ncbi:MAG: D-alanyl-D-alanine carboxypeptidase [Clostridia bacterium]|nr:D-alanyl-D-alanine carboxypeptidase [Clostridia bacterium]